MSSSVKSPSNLNTMHSFSEQCLDMARSILGHNLSAINDEGSIIPTEGEFPRVDEPGHAALAIGEFYRATNESTFEGRDLVDLAARTITAQAFREPVGENGLAYAALALLSFGPSKERNPVWERLVDLTRERLDKLLLTRSDYDNHWQAFNISKAVARFSLGLSKKDETGRLIERFLARLQQTSTTGFMDDASPGIGGHFNLYGVLSFVFIRQALQLHCNPGLRERKLPSLRTHAEKYLKLIPDMVREDGLGWAYGHAAGAYGQMHLISLLLQSFRDNWIPDDQKTRYFDILRRLFFFFYINFLDLEEGYLVIRDAERSAFENHTTRMANFDAARYLCQWARLAKTIAANENTPVAPFRSGCRYVIFDRSNRKEQGLLLYRNADSGLQIQLPLVSSGGAPSSDYLPIPNCPGVFDRPNNTYLPVMLPELTFHGKRYIPAYYGKRCTTGLGLRKAFFFRYEQPDLISVDEQIASDIGSCKVNWTFLGNKVTSEFIFSVKSQIQLDRFRYALVIGSPHSRYRVDTSPVLGPEGLRCIVQKDDFQGIWMETEIVTNDPAYRTNYNNIHYVQMLQRDHPLIMRPGQVYRLIVSFDPDIVYAGE